MLATQRQLNYLQDLADKVENIKRRKPSLVPLGIIHRNFRREWRENGITSREASRLIDIYLSVIRDIKSN